MPNWVNVRIRTPWSTRRFSASIPRAPVAVLLPAGGCNEWDRPGAPLHDAAGLAAFCDEMRRRCPGNASLHELDCHINDAEFAAKALEIFDSWIASGVVNGG